MIRDQGLDVAVPPLNRRPNIRSPPHQGSRASLLLGDANRSQAWTEPEVR